MASQLSTRQTPTPQAPPGVPYLGLPLEVFIFSHYFFFFSFGFELRFWVWILNSIRLHLALACRCRCRYTVAAFGLEQLRGPHPPRHLCIWLSEYLSISALPPAGSTLLSPLSSAHRFPLLRCNKWRRIHLFAVCQSACQ